MPHLLKNKNLEIHFDLPLENYQGTRFDWTGKITQVKFQGIHMVTLEQPTLENETAFGKGFYNEFGIDSALGYDATKVGEWFHKIGVGLLKKETNTPYDFNKDYPLKPANFKVNTSTDKIIIHCSGEKNKGYAYALQKTITLHLNGFHIKYELKNTGEKDLVTEEYTHNFIGINHDLMGKDTILKFPFLIQPQAFKETVNPEEKVLIGQQDITVVAPPSKPFFFSDLSGGKKHTAAWEINNLKHKLRISETGSFQTNKINLWGWQHVISPELFHRIAVQPGQTSEWSRNYHIHKIT